MRSSLAFVAAFVIAGAAALGVYLFRPPAAPTAPLVAPTVAVAAPSATAVAAATSIPAVSTAAPAATDVPTVTAASALREFVIDAEASTARYLIDEVLRGAPFTVVGTTPQVAGIILLDPADLSSVQLGEILINARTFATDNGFRDRAVQNVVLRTAEFEYIRFVPTAIEGLPAQADVGATVSFTVRGDLTVTDQTQAVDFTVTVSADSADRISGRAEAVIAWRDFGLRIPDSPAVNSVEDTLTLQLDFVAQAKP